VGTTLTCRLSNYHRKERVHAYRSFPVVRLPWQGGEQNAHLPRDRAIDSVDDFPVFYAADSLFAYARSSSELFLGYAAFLEQPGKCGRYDKLLWILCRNHVDKN